MIIFIIGAALESVLPDSDTYYSPTGKIIPQWGEAQKANGQLKHGIYIKYASKHLFKIVPFQR